jgi:hypothetical protein
MERNFCENLVTRIIPWLLCLGISMIGSCIPLLQSNHVVIVSLSLIFVLSVLGCIKAIFVNHPVVVLKEGGMVLRGLRPGMWKIFKCWVVERIDDSSVNLIRVGYLRDKMLGGLVSYPPGELSGGAVFQMFLWVKYNRNGREMNIYYPHLKNISGFMELINCLETRYGSKVEKSLNRPT